MSAPLPRSPSDSSLATSDGPDRDQRTGTQRLWWERLGQDVRFSLRQLRRAPGFAATVILTLALGIGACTVVFTVVHSILLQMADTPRAARTVVIHETQLPQRPQMPVSPPAFADLKADATVFESLTAWFGDSTTLTDGAEPLQLKTGSMTEGMFEEWRSSMAAGRLFLSDEFVAGKNNVAIITFGLWKRQFGADKSVVGRTVHFDGRPFTIVGVLPRTFERLGSDVDIWMPLVFTDAWRADRLRGMHNLGVGGVLKPGVSVQQAQAELNVLAARTAAAFPVTNKGVGLLVRSFASYLNRFIAPLLYVLLATVGCVLLIACANVANLLLARATVRQREISVRAALGAGRGRLMRQLLVESIVLAVAGGAVGVLLAEVGLHFVRTFAPSAGTDLARLAMVRLDAPMLAFTLAFSIATGLVFGIVPAWTASRANLNDALKQSARGTDGAGRGRLRAALVVIEVALAVTLVACTGLLIRSFRAVSRLDVGYSPEGVAVLQVNLRAQRYGRDVPARVAFTDELLARVRSLPGVDTVAATTVTPLNVPTAFPFRLDGRSLAAPGSQPAAITYAVTPDYFRTLHMRVIAGRGFSVDDTTAGPAVVVINEALARQYFGDENPVGRQLNLAPPGSAESWADIVGVVNNVMQGGPSEYLPPQLYVPFAQRVAGGYFLVAHTTGDPAALLPLLKAQVYAVDRDQPVLAMRTLSQWFQSTTARHRLTLNLLTVFAGIALIIAAVGIYGVMAYAVSQRTMEFGVRMALGATRGDVLRDVLRRGMVLAGSGIGVGLLATLAGGRLIRAFLVDVSARDPLTLAATAGGLLVVAFAACLLPALRATTVDPMVALRVE